MNRRELVREVARKHGITRHEADAVLDCVLNTIGSALAAGNRVELRGFGIFVARHHPAYTGRDPRTGDPVEVKPKVVPVFRPSKELRLCCGAVLPEVDEEAGP